MFVSKNVHQIKAGDRVRLTNKLVNPDSSWMPEEDLPVGLEGSVLAVSENSTSLCIHMKWDNGSGLALLENDCYSYEKVER